MCESSSSARAGLSSATSAVARARGRGNSLSTAAVMMPRVCGSGRVHILSCAVAANRSDFAAGLIRLFLFLSRHRAAAFGRRDGPERVACRP